MTTYQLGNTGTNKLLNYKENLWMWTFSILWSTSQPYKIWRRGYNWQCQIEEANGNKIQFQRVESHLIKHLIKNLITLILQSIATIYGWSKKTKVSVESYSTRKEKVLSKVKMNIKHLKSNTKQHTKPVLHNDKVKTHLESLLEGLLFLQMIKL